MNCFACQSLAKSYGRIPAVRDVSFHVNSGEVFGLLGPNGAGKTTTMLMAAGLLTPDSGSILLNGTVVNCQEDSWRKRLGLAPQDLAIYPDLTAGENVQFFAKLYGLRGPLLIERTSDALECVGLFEFRDRYAATFSGGMKRRLNLAIALVHRPEILILDEPTVGVDPQSRSRLLECVRNAAESGTAIIYCSHYMDEVEAICQRVAIVDQGRVLAQGTLAELLVDEMSQIDVWLEPSNMEYPRPSPWKYSSESDGTARYSLTAAQTVARADVARLMRVVTETGHQMQKIEWNEPNLERLFLNFTGRTLRDA